MPVGTPRLTRIGGYDELLATLAEDGNQKGRPDSVGFVDELAPSHYDHLPIQWLGILAGGIFMILMVAYDLHEPDRDYAEVIACIKKFGSWCHLEESVWLVDTSSSPGDVRDALKKVGTDATYFVQQVTQNWASYGEAKDKTDWLKSEKRNW